MKQGKRNHKKRHGVNRMRSLYDRRRHQRAVLARALFMATRRRWCTIARLVFTGQAEDWSTAAQMVDERRKTPSARLALLSYWMARPGTKAA